MELAAIEKEALLLPDTDRALLADRLLASLSRDTESQCSHWVAEAESRFEAYQSGELSAVDGPQALADLRPNFRKWSTVSPNPLSVREFV